MKVKNTLLQGKQWMLLGSTLRNRYIIKKPSIEKKTQKEMFKLHLCFFCFAFAYISVQDAIFRVVAAVLHLGNIDFAKGKEMDSSTPKDEKSWFHLKTAAELFM